MSKFQPLPDAAVVDSPRGLFWLKRLLIITLFLGGAFLLAQQVLRRASGAEIDEPSPSPSDLLAVDEEAPALRTDREVCRPPAVVPQHRVVRVVCRRPLLRTRQRVLWCRPVRRPGVIYLPMAHPADGDAPEVAPPADELPPAPEPDPYAWRELFDGETLEGWEPTRFGGEGEVSVTDEGTILLDMGHPMTGITYQGDVPRTNYEIELEGMRLDGIDFFATTTFPVGEDHCSFVTGGWGGSVVGLSTIDYYDAAENPTTRFFSFKPEVWYTFRIRVTDSLIEAWIDDERFVAQGIEDHRIGIRFESEPSRPLGISAYMTRSALGDIRIRRLSPEEVEAAAAELERLGY